MWFRSREPLGPGQALKPSSVLGWIVTSRSDGGGGSRWGPVAVVILLVICDVASAALAAVCPAIFTFMSIYHK